MSNKQFYCIAQPWGPIWGVGETEEAALADANSGHVSEAFPPFEPVPFSVAGDKDVVCVPCTVHLYDEVVARGGDIDYTITKDGAYLLYPDER